jgi:hypothetical protein
MPRHVEQFGDRFPHRAALVIRRLASDFEFLDPPIDRPAAHSDASRAQPENRRGGRRHTAQAEALFEFVKSGGRHRHSFAFRGLPRGRFAGASATFGGRPRPRKGCEAGGWLNASHVTSRASANAWAVAKVGSRKPCSYLVTADKCRRARSASCA